MGLNSLHRVVEAQSPDPADLNQYETALVGDHVPRNMSGEPQEKAGSIGTESLPWSETHTEKLFVDGQSILPQTSAGGRSVAAQLRNGVINGLSPVGREGYPGYMVQAGSRGIQILANTSTPLEVVLDGVSYRYDNNYVGGGETLPPAQLVQSASYDLDLNDGQGQLYPCGGGVFNTGLTPPSETAGDIMFLEFTNSNNETEYIQCYKYDDLSPVNAVLGTRGIVNTSETDFATVVGGDLPAAASGSDTQRGVNWRLVQTGYVFFNPVTDPPEIRIEDYVVGAVASQLPSGVFPIGSMVFHEFTGRWHRHDGAGWRETDRVYLGTCVLSNGRVVGVCPVRTQRQLLELIDVWEGIGGHPLTEEIVGDRLELYRVDAEREFERKTNASLTAQTLPAINPDYSFEPSSEEGVYGIYLDVLKDEVFDEIWQAPQVLDTGAMGGSAILTHPARHAIFLGSYAVDSVGAYVGARFNGEDVRTPTGTTGPFNTPTGATTMSVVHPVVNSAMLGGRASGPPSTFRPATDPMDRDQARYNVTSVAGEMHASMPVPNTSISITRALTSTDATSRDITVPDLLLHFGATNTAYIDEFLNGVNSDDLAQEPDPTP